MTNDPEPAPDDAPLDPDPETVMTEWRAELGERIAATLATSTAKKTKWKSKAALGLLGWTHVAFTAPPVLYVDEDGRLIDAGPSEWEQLELLEKYLADAVQEEKDFRLMPGIEKQNAGRDNSIITRRAKAGRMKRLLLGRAKQMLKLNPTLKAARLGTLIAHRLTHRGIRSLHPDTIARIIRGAGVTA